MERSDSDFLRDYEERTKGYQIHTIVDSEDEGSFSWSPCDTCGSPLGGTRYDCVLTNPGADSRGRRKPQVKVRSCTDCVVFAANGTLPSGA